MRIRRVVAAAAAAGAVVAPTMLAGASSAAEPERPPFYETPTTMPAANGDIIRHETSAFYLDPLKAVPVDVNVQRIMYRSTERTNTPVAVTGTVLTPKQAWPGGGPRPVVAFAVGAQGLADRCAPSRQLAAGTEYEGVFIEGLLVRGYGVVVTDYQGLGTEGVHTFGSREAQGRAVLDSIRAAQRLPEANLPDDGPVAITGYSQGGMAAASAAELAGSYAPELKLKGTAAGGTPGDLGLVARNLDGSPFFGLLGFALAGLSEAHDIDIRSMLNDRGDQFIDKSEQSCTTDATGGSAFGKFSDLTEDGRGLEAYLSEEPFRTVINEQTIGYRKPNAPVLMTHSVLDEVIPYEAGRGVAKRWCGRGATVNFSTNVVPEHVGGAIAHYPEALAFLESRFAGLPANSNCGLLW